jgi:hypothetical protein
MHNTRMNTNELPKGYLGEQNGLVYFHDGRDVYRAPRSNVVDVRTGYLQGRWECTVEHWNRFAQAVYGLPLVTKESK